MTPKPKDDIVQDDRDATNGSGDEHVPTEDTAPPGNPETDQAAVDKAEEQMGKVVGR